MSDNVLDNVPKVKPFWSPLAEHEVTPPDWLIDGWLPLDSFGVLFGQPSAGKSFLALDISAIIASGRPSWHGHKTKGEPLPVFYLCGEGKNGLRLRLEAWKMRGSNSVVFEQVKDNLFISETSANLTDLDDVERLCESIEKINPKPALIVIDTLARNFGGQDENATQAMNAFVNHCDLLRSRLNGMAVLVVHHTGHKERERPRGSIALIGASDFAIFAENHADIVNIKSTRMKDGEPPKPLALKFERVLVAKDNEGLGVYSSHLTKADGFEPKPKGLGGLQETMMNHLKDLRDASKANGLNGEVLLADLKEAWRKDGQEVSRIKRTLESLESRLMVRLSGEVIYLRQ